MKRLFLSLVLIAVVTVMQKLPAMSMNEWAAWMKFEQLVNQYGGISGYQAHLDALEQAGLATTGASAGVGAGTVVAVGGSIVGITLGGATIY